MHTISGVKFAMEVVVDPALDTAQMYRWLSHWLLNCRASDKCQREKRKTINGDDLIWAMSTLGFEEYVEPLKLYLFKYREVNK